MVFRKIVAPASLNEHDLAILFTPKKKLPYVGCFPPGVGSYRWKQLVLAAHTNSLAKNPHFFNSVLHKSKELVTVDNAEVIGRSVEVYKFILVRNPYERLLSTFLSKIAPLKTPWKIVRGLRADGNFSSFVHALARIPVSKRPFFLQPMVQSHRACMLAQCQVLRIEHVNFWYSELVSKLELTDVVSNERFWGNEGCFYRPCNVSCEMAESYHSTDNCWSGVFHDAKVVNKKVMRTHYTDHFTLRRAFRLVESDLLAFGYPVRKL